MQKDKRAKNSLLLMITTFVSRVLGILRSRTIAVFFGASKTADIINFSFNIPNNFRKLFSEGSLSSAFIPVFVSEIDRDKDSLNHSKSLFYKMQAFQLIISTFLIVFTFLFKENIILFLSEFRNPKDVQFAAKLLFYFVIFLCFITFSALYASLLQSHNKFLIAALSPLIFSISVILFITYFEKSLGAYSMALGVIVGGVGQLIINYLALRNLDYKFKFSFSLNDDPFKRVLKGWAPVTLTTVLAIITQQVSYYFASTLQEGTITAFTNSIIIWQAPYGIFYSAIATVFFPSLAAAYLLVNKEEFNSLVERGILYIITFLLPITIMVVTLRNETTATLLQSGKFSYQDSLVTANILLYFLLGMVFVACYGFMQRVHYSMKSFKYTLYAAITVTLLNIAFTYYLIKNSYGAISLSIANSISHIIGLIILIFLAKTEVTQIFKSNSFLRKLATLILANIPLIVLAVAYNYLKIEEWYSSGSTKLNLLKLTAIYIIALLCVTISYSIAKIDFLTIFKRGQKRVKS